MEWRRGSPSNRILSASAPCRVFQANRRRLQRIERQFSPRFGALKPQFRSTNRPVCCASHFALVRPSFLTFAACRFSFLFKFFFSDGDESRGARRSRNSLASCPVDWPRSTFGRPVAANFRFDVLRVRWPRACFSRRLTLAAALVLPTADAEAKAASRCRRSAAAADMLPAQVYSQLAQGSSAFNDPLVQATAAAAFANTVAVSSAAAAAAAAVDPPSRSTPPTGAETRRW